MNYIIQAHTRGPTNPQYLTNEGWHERNANILSLQDARFEIKSYRFRAFNHEDNFDSYNYNIISITP